jgi:hypothetical protein
LASRPQILLRDLLIIQLYKEGVVIKEIVRRLSLENRWIVYRALGKDRRKHGGCTCQACLLSIEELAETPETAHPNRR